MLDKYVSGKYRKHAELILKQKLMSRRPSTFLTMAYIMFLNPKLYYLEMVALILAG